MVAQVGQDLVRTLVRNGVMGSFLTGSPVARGRSSELLQNTDRIQEEPLQATMRSKGQRGFSRADGTRETSFACNYPNSADCSKGGKLTGQGVSPLVPTRAQSSRVYAVGR